MRVIILALLLCPLLAATAPERPLDPYEVLQLTAGASRQEVRRAFKELSLQYHPDINPGARRHYQRIIEAYEALKKVINEPLTETDEFP
jgi:preprotein translocase subunit Sec63